MKCRKLRFECIGSSDEFVVFNPEWLCEKVRFVQIAGFPDNLELALGNAISDPVVAHGCCLEFFYFYFLVCGVIGSGVVGDEYGAVLWIVDAGEDVLQNASSLGHHEHTGVFGFTD